MSCIRPSHLELGDLFDQFNKNHFENKILKTNVEISERLTSSTGSATWKYTWETKVTFVGLSLQKIRAKKCTPMLIKISGPIFDNYGWNYTVNGWPYSEFHNTLIHEMTHLYLAEHFNDEGHSRHFHHIMGRITGVPGNHRCHNLNIAGIVANKKVKVSNTGKVVSGLRLSIF